MKKIFSILLCIGLVAGFVACEKDKEFELTKLSVENETITPSYESADVSCRLKADATISEAYVHYSLSSSFAKYEVAKMSEEKGVYVAQLTSLQDNTIYYIRYSVSNKYSSVVTEDVDEFKTLQCSIPTIVLDTISDVMDSHAKVKICLVFDGGASVMDMGVCWSTQAYPTTEDIRKSTKDTLAILDLTSLQPNTKYYVRAYAINKVGAAYSDDMEFTTYALPEVRTEEVSDIQLNSAQLAATLLFDGNDKSTIKGFCWSDTSEPTIDGEHIAVDNANAAYSYLLTELLSETQYFVRAYAQNKIGVVYGEEKTFTTNNSVQLPSVTTATITQITINSAVVGGNVTSDGNASVTERGVCVATSSNPTTANTKISAGSGTGEFTCNLTGLQEGTKYYVRAYAVNSKGTAYGEEVVFTTTVAGVPTITTTQPSQVTETTAVSGGNVTSDGGASVTERGVVYSLSASPSIADLSSTIIRSGSGTGAFTCNLSNLQAGTTYYVRAYAVNSKGTAYGDEISFTTALPVSLASVTTASISNITETTALAGGNVTSDGNASVTERGVCISTVSNPTTANTKITAGSGMGEFICNLTGLQANTTYYVRAYVINSEGAAYGEEVCFTTLGHLSDPTGTENGHGYVDLGLSVKWATYNVGASSPEEYGTYFAWGETTTKSIYNSNTYKYFNATSYTKYNTKTSKTTLELSDDAAHANWGGNWRMPTSTEWAELRENCTWIWITQNGKNGYKVTSKLNGNSIFLCAAGYRIEGSHEGATNNGNYWSSSLDTDYTSRAWALHFGSSGLFWVKHERYLGQSVRPILDEKVIEIAAPMVITASVTSLVTETSAVAGGNVTSDGGASVTERGVVYSTVSNPTTANTKITAGSGTGEFTCNLTGLQANTTYYVRAYAVNSKGTAYGEQVSFTTNKTIVLPSVTTSVITQITQTTAVVGGSVTADGNASVTERGVVYSTVSNPVINNIYHTTITSGSGTGSFSVNLTNLVEGTTYYVRAYAVNSAGVSYGEEVSFMTNEQSSTPNDGTSHEYVDLGLSVKWATCNVGATKPEEYGDYFAWGETTTKSTYNWSTYKWCNGSSSTMTKYNTNSSYGTVDNKTQLELSDDAARANWGGSWRMPTKAEQDELCNNCTWTWTTQNGVNGYKVTSKSNGNSIFLPAAGDHYVSSFDGAGSYGSYWSSSLYTGYPSAAYELHFVLDHVGWAAYDSRYCGQSVRPVCQ